MTQNEIAILRSRWLSQESDVFKRVDKTGACWLWTGRLDRRGYGLFYGSVNGKNRAFRAHRLIYALLREVVPKELQLDHACRVHNCVNPDHLDIVTARENVLRGIGPTAVNAHRTHCRNGHQFDDKNTYINPTSGYRKCRICAAVRALALLRKRRALIASAESIRKAGK